MNKIIVGILTFLVWIMPWFTPLYTELQRRTFDENVIWSAVVQHVENHDAAALAAMSRPWLKNNVSDLTGKITALLDAIDGNIEGVAVLPDSYPNYYEGVRSVGRMLGILTDADEAYTLRVVYEYTNVHDRNEIGIARLQLIRGINGRVLADIKTPQYK
ncbi:MAG: DUF5104 domain-containing protein [Firmicutes bacterium]|nr:DUF5104 domain-containing protein [Bacillota bacterium]